MKNKKLSLYCNSIVGILVMAALLVIINLVCKPVNARMDCTADKLYTLSDGTKTTLQNLTDPVSIRFYYSKDIAKMPVFLKNYATRVEDLLREYKQLAAGKLDIKKLNPKPDTDAEDAANLDGITGRKLDMFGDEQVYLGLAVSCGDRTESIPFLSPEREKLLEYDLTRAILSVKSARKPKIGVLSALKVMGGYDDPMAMMQGRAKPQPPWIIVKELKQTYDVVELNPANLTAVADDITVVLAIHPKDLPDTALFALDQFVLRGGRLVAFLDPMSVVDLQTSNPQRQQFQPPAVSSTLDPLLKTWGIQFDTEQLVLDKLLAEKGRGATNPVLLAVDKDHIETEDPATAQLSSLALLCAGTFSGTPADGLTKQSLLKTSEESQLVHKMMVMQGAFDFDRTFKADGTAKDLAIRLTGKFKTAYPDGAPAPKAEPSPDGQPPKETKAPEPPAGGWLKESAKDGAVVLVGDADMLFDGLCVEQQQFLGQVLVQPLNHNLALAQNLIEYMSGDSVLFSIRSRGGEARPFKRVRDMELEAQKRFQAKISELEQEEQDVGRKLNELQRQRKPGDRELLSAEQKAEIKKLRQRRADARRELQVVRKQLRKDIDSLENNVMLVNIGLMPLLIALGGIAYALCKRLKSTH